jgi:predicted ATP-grasp superfamily ATP-dependent carboligase
MKSMSLPAIVSTASGPAAVTITQTLGRRGIPIHALSNMKHAAAFYSRYTVARHRTPIGVGGSDLRNNVEEPEALLDYLENHVERGVLFPGSDNNIRFLARHKQRLLDAGFRMCIPDEDVLNKALNKSDVTVVCRRHGFPVPQTIVVDSRDDLAEVRRELQFPIVLKGVYKKNHRLVRGAGQLASEYDAFLSRFRGKTERHQAVAQEWIPGGPETFAKLYVMCDLDGRVVATHQLRRLRVQTRRDGSQGDTLVAKTERIPEMVEQWLPFFEAIGWVGMASMECKYDERDGLYKLIEINPRPWAILKVSVDAGVDIPLLYYKLAQGERVEPLHDFRENQYYIRLLWGNLDAPEPAAALSMLWFGHIGLREVLSVYGRLLRNVKRLTVDVGRPSDPMPTLAAIYHQGIHNFKDWF